MKLRWVIICTLVAVLLQLTWPGSEKWYMITPNFFLVNLVVLSAFLEPRPLLWLAFAGGLLFDLMGASQFGLSMAYYILMALILKLVWRTNTASLQSFSLILATALFSLAFFVLSQTNALSTVYFNQWRLLAGVAALEVVINSLLTMLIVAGIQVRRRGIIRG